MKVADSGTIEACRDIVLAMKDGLPLADAWQEVISTLPVAQQMVLALNVAELIKVRGEAVTPSTMILAIREIANG